MESSQSPAQSEQADEPVGKATRTCIASFKSRIAALDDGTSKDYLEARFADLKLWADSVGALTHGKASLDWRLSGRTSDAFLVTSLLEMLKAFLDGYKTEKSSNDDDDDNHEARDGIDKLTKNLAWIGSTMRRSGTRSRLQTADVAYERDRAGQDKESCDVLRAQLICILTSQPLEVATSADCAEILQTVQLTEIQDRLVEANLRRLHRFRYARRHADGIQTSKAAHHMPSPLKPAGPSSSPAVDYAQNPALRVHPAVPKHPESHDLDETHTTDVTTASALDGRFKGLEVGQTRYGQTRMPRSNAITGFAQTPRAATIQLDEGTILCSFCCQALPLEEAEDRDLLVKHITQDVSPYTCVVDDCPSPYRLYNNQADWKDHVLNDHRPKWRCSRCPGQTPIFGTLRSFILHLQEQHDNLALGDSFETVIDQSTFQTFGISSCPLCHEHGPTDSPELIQHVLGHVYDFSMYADYQVADFIESDPSIAPEVDGSVYPNAENSLVVAIDTDVRTYEEGSPSYESTTHAETSSVSMDVQAYERVFGKNMLTMSGTRSDREAIALEHPLRDPAPQLPLVAGVPPVAPAFELFPSLPPESRKRWLPSRRTQREISTGIRCELCGHISSSNSAAKKHMQRHERVWKCDVQGCDRAIEGFSRLNDLDRHLKTVHMRVPLVGSTAYYVCSVCQHEDSKNKNKCWRRKDNFKAHVERTHVLGGDPRDEENRAYIVDHIIRQSTRDARSQGVNTPSAESAGLSPIIGVEGRSSVQPDDQTKINQDSRATQEPSDLDPQSQVGPSNTGLSGALGSYVQKRSLSETRSVQAQNTHLQYGCDECGGVFSSKHDLARHQRTKHSAIRRVFVCVEPADDSDIELRKPLRECSPCRARKAYDREYNAVAHLWRMHLNPVSRGRRPQGEHSRPGRSVEMTPGLTPMMVKLGWVIPIMVDRAGKEVAGPHHEKKTEMFQEDNDLLLEPNSRPDSDSATKENDPFEDAPWLWGALDVHSSHAPVEEDLEAIQSPVHGGDDALVWPSAATSLSDTGK